jgi:hypothetical protein
MGFVSWPIAAYSEFLVVAMVWNPSGSLASLSPWDIHFGCKLAHPRFEIGRVELTAGSGFGKKPIMGGGTYNTHIVL